jgi:hypothetical protein
MENYSAIKNDIMSFAGKWIELETILSKISKEQKDKYYIFIHMQNLGLKWIIMKTGNEHKRWTTGGLESVRGEEVQSILPIYIWRQHNETHQILFENEKKGYKKGENLFKVHCMNLWNFHNATPLYYQWFLKIKKGEITKISVIGKAINKICLYL